MIGNNDPVFIIFLIAVVAWGIVWKGIGLWKAGKNNQIKWFVPILIFNTLGILPLIYIKFFQKKVKGK